MTQNLLGVCVIEVIIEYNIVVQNTSTILMSYTKYTFLVILICIKLRCKNTFCSYIQYRHIAYTTHHTNLVHHDRCVKVSERKQSRVRKYPNFQAAQIPFQTLRVVDRTVCSFSLLRRWSMADTNAEILFTKSKK